MLRTKRQREALCPECPVARVAHVLGHSCSLLVLRDLLHSPRRFSELQASLAGVSTRTLTNTLRRLEREGFVVRTALKKPHRIEYAPSAKGAALKPLIAAMAAYGRKYL